MVGFIHGVNDSPNAPADGNKGERPLVAYGVNFLEEKETRLKLIKQNVRQRLPSKLRRNRSASDLDSGIDSPDSATSQASGCSTSTKSDDVITEDDWKQFDYHLENLAMSGGGAKGYAYIGALKALEDAGALSGIQRVVGTSAGAVMGGMLAVGANAQEIADFFKCNVKKLFQDKNATMCLFLPRLLTKFGINSGQRFYDMYGDFLASKAGDPDVTFLQVYEKFGKEICVTVTNLSRMCSEYCHYTTTPDLPLRQAIKISMAFPGVYESMKIDLFGEGTNMYVDGGTLENFPVQYFDEIDPVTSQPIYNEKTLGLYLISEDQFSHKKWMETFQTTLHSFPSYLPDTKLAKLRLRDEMKRRRKQDKTFDAEKYKAELVAEPYVVDGKSYMRHYDTRNKDLIDIKGPKNYFRAMLSTLLLSQKHMLVKPTDLKRTIAINCGYIDTKDTSIEPGDREFMIRQGYEQTRNFLLDYVRQNPRRRRSKSHTIFPRPLSLPAALMSYGSLLQKTKARGQVLPSPTELDKFVSQAISRCDSAYIPSDESSPSSSTTSTPSGTVKTPVFDLGPSDDTFPDLESSNSSDSERTIVIAETYCDSMQVHLEESIVTKL